jgi:predicted DCC family thiol-disulfide oxidoreductase YuxK
MRKTGQNSAIVLFDGVCNLCNGFVNFLIENDKKQVFKFLALQSPLAQKYIQQAGIDPKIVQELNTVILIKNSKAYYKSQAVIEIAQQLQYPWKTLAVGKFLPKYILNYIYDFVAKNRYRRFGKKETCMIPSPRIKDRFLDSQTY